MADPIARRSDGGERLALVGVLLALAALATWRHLRPAPALPRLPATSVEPWMADALPGVGPVRRTAAVAAIRAGDPEALPSAARTTARQVFSFDP